MLEGGLDDGVYDTLQPPDDRIHVAELNVPPAPLSLHDTVPVVVVGALDVSVTCTENVDALPADAVPELGVTVVLVACDC